MSVRAVRIEGLERLLRKVDTIARQPKTKTAVRRAGELVQRKLREYPPERHGPAFLSANREKRRRQLAAIFAKLAAGEIPYRRTRRLARGWRFDYRSVRSDMVATLTNETRYAHWVQGDARQAMYHKVTGWKTAGAVLRQAEVEAVRIVFAAVEETVQSG